ncbi:LOG family protein [Permianibacter sp. IMCC34836]|uniref:nucleotide 5'-monophosphate nucleosidase PpnN n=1 Tax=Permianibacter fluminis TaxID=2738515 RepID=UPI0015550337|nr:nucleotide 5'-monophosphate nucleosidase PpnN [Permianibacter fluminis]NQD36770.1 LOG family protein [Permianibacter fluminis]
MTATAPQSHGNYATVNASIRPKGRLELLSKLEIDKLLDTSQRGLHTVFRNCTLAVLSSGNDLDSGKELLERYPNFNVQIIQEARGIKLEISGAPATAFVDGEMIRGMREHVFSVLRDIIYVSDEIAENPRFDLAASAGITDAVFHILRNAKVLRPGAEPNLAVCWGGHSISREEYDYTKLVGYQLGLRGLNICTGCGPGAMKGPMKGATIGHSKQRISGGQYIGLTEPGIIAAEAPNPIVNNLVILPDIEKRLEAFVRVGHAIVIFPGGAGTAEEILYLLGVLLHPANQAMPFPLIFTGPASAASYFERVHEFIGHTLGAGAQSRYQIIIDDPVAAAQAVQAGIAKVREFRRNNSDAYCFNWLLQIAPAFQQPFVPTHASMRALDLHSGQPAHELAANLRRAFSGVVTGNVKEQGVRAIEQHGPYEISGEAAIMTAMDALLAQFVAQGRMRLPGRAYTPCYRIVC